MIKCGLWRHRGGSRELGQDGRDITLLQGPGKFWKPILLVALVGSAVSIASVIYGLAMIVYLIAFVVLVIVLGRYPEVFLTLFVFAGIFKSYPALSLPLNLDWTATMGIAAIFSMVLRGALVKERMRIAITRTDFFIAGLVLVLGFGLMYSRDRVYGIERVLELLFLGVVASYVLPRVIAGFASPVKMVRNILLTIFALASVTTLLALLGFGAGDRAFAGSYLPWAYFLGIAILSGLTLLSVSSNKLLRLGIVILEPLLLVKMFLAQARGPLISLIVVVGVILFWKGRLSIGKKIGIALSFLAVFGMLFIILPRGIWSRYELLFAEQKGASIQARVHAYKLAGELFLEHPLLGVGTGDFCTFDGSRESPYSPSYAHNAFLEVGAENGLLGLFFYVGFLMSLFLFARSILKDIKTVKILWELTFGCLLVFIFLFVGSQFSGAIIGRDGLLFAGLIVLLGTEARRHGSARRVLGTNDQ